MIIIVFESTILPKYAGTLDFLGMYELLPEISEEASLWLWRFCIICSNETNEGNLVVRMITEVITLLRANAEHLEKRIPEFSFNDDPKYVIKSWEESLEKILELATDKEFCVWEVRHVDEERP